MRALVQEIFARRMPEPPAEFLALQASRLNEALLVAYGAMSGPTFGRPTTSSKSRASSTAATVSSQPSGAPVPTRLGPEAPSQSPLALEAPLTGRETWKPGNGAATA